ncbi:hypothetical protein CHARACLAT_011085, partial [Characodon lateralis]|nr:hypothetical protein [Characodon lateralis]
MQQETVLNLYYSGVILTETVGRNGFIVTETHRHLKQHQRHQQLSRCETWAFKRRSERSSYFNYVWTEQGGLSASLGLLTCHKQRTRGKK